ncbi:MAG: Gfo/Idh/MocA family oxidoreductase [Clostridia bacterium]
MKIGFIGASGHFQQCLTAKYDSLEYIGCCKSALDEDITPLIAAFNSLGINPVIYDNVDALLDSGIDTVVVDGIFNTHSECIIKALKKNINVISEKPLATTIEDYYALKEIVLASKSRLFTLFTMRYEGCFATVKDMLAKEAIGKIRLINAQKSYKLGSRPDFYKSRQAFGGFIPWVGIHMIDLILWYTGKKVIDLNAYQSRLYNKGHKELEVSATINMQLEEEILTVINADYLRPNNMAGHGDDRIRIVGTHGIIEVQNNEVFLNGCKIKTKDTQPIFQAFVNNGVCDGLYSTEIALLAQASADKGVKNATKI